MKTSGRRGARRSANSPPTTPPAPEAATIADQAPTPPRSVLATTGPRTFQAPLQRLPTAARGDDRDQPGQRAERGPAGAQLVEERLGRARGAAGAADRRSRRRARRRPRSWRRRRRSPSRRRRSRRAGRRAAARRSGRPSWRGCAARWPPAGPAAETTSGRKPVAVGLKTPVAAPVTARQRGEQRDAAAAADQHGGDRALRADPDDVGGDQDRAPRQAVADDAAAEQERDHRQRPRGQDDPDVGGAAAVVEDAERERDGDHLVAEQRRQLGAEEQAVLALVQDGGQPHPRSLAHWWYPSRRPSRPRCAGRRRAGAS